jgi:hypothetical protein
MMGYDLLLMLLLLLLLLLVVLVLALLLLLLLLMMMLMMILLLMMLLVVLVWWCCCCCCCCCILAKLQTPTTYELYLQYRNERLAKEELEKEKQRSELEKKLERVREVARELTEKVVMEEVEELHKQEEELLQQGSAVDVQPTTEEPLEGIMSRCVAETVYYYLFLSRLHVLFVSFNFIAFVVL